MAYGSYTVSQLAKMYAKCLMGIMRGTTDAGSAQKEPEQKPAKCPSDTKKRVLDTSTHSGAAFKASNALEVP